MAILFSFGIPFLFYFLVRRYQALGKHGDKVVHEAIGWCYEPFRAGCEWWLLAEMLRVLLLTSTIGFISHSCYIKLLMAQLIARRTFAEHSRTLNPAAFHSSRRIFIVASRSANR